MEKVEKEFFNEELLLLADEFDSEDTAPLCKPNSRYSYEEMSKDDDPADTIDVFANMLNNESRYYPKHWQ